VAEKGGAKMTREDKIILAPIRLRTIAMELQNLTGDNKYYESLPTSSDSPLALVIFSPLIVLVSRNGRTQRLYHF
jgi:hypothetical protein